VLAIGLVVDDAIVVLENIYRRIEEGEPPLLAAFNGSRQVAFAVVATSVVVVAVFLPLAFQNDYIGRIFAELAVTISAAIIISTVLALSLTPMLCSKILRHSWAAHRVSIRSPIGPPTATSAAGDRDAGCTLCAGRGGRAAASFNLPPDDSPRGPGHPRRHRPEGASFHARPTAGARTPGRCRWSRRTPGR
jgi:multidrug efflux pump subunit AcrB